MSERVQRAIRAQARGGRALVVGAGLILLALAFNPWFIARLFSPDGSFEHPVVIATIIGVEVLLLSAGVFLVLRRPVITNADLLASALSWLLLLAGVEVLMRFAYRQDDLWYATMRSSETIGWVTREDFEITRDLPNYGHVAYTTGDHGFRRWGDPSARRPRVIVLGDSYTEAAQVTDGGTYYDWLADSSGLEMEVFAYGASAYGSLQEFLILDRFIDQIRPDLILWQFCSNDIINNFRPLEARSLFENSWWRRPYLEQGEVRMRAPSLSAVTQVSRLAQFIAARRAIVRAERVRTGASDDRSIEAELSPEHSLLRESAGVTRRILEMARERAGGVPIVAFSVDRPAWLGRTFEDVAGAAGVRFVDGVPEAIAAAKAAGRRVDGVTNAHWNSAGHGIAARLLADSLRAWGLPSRGAAQATQVATDGSGRRADVRAP